MSASHSSSSATTQQPGRSVGASASAAAPKQNTVLVSGESKDSVTVQSQLATSHVAGDVSSKSNIGQVVNDLSAAHNASTGWMDAETERITKWGQGEIERVLAQTKGMEEQLIAGAKEKQKALDASHSGELQRLVKEMDLRKAAELKELEDGLQRQIQATLTTSKNEINRVETEMNNRKMDLLKQSQLKSAKEIDALSNLVVETKLVPSQTRTVIETNTNTGNVVAVATGGSISTGAAQADSYSSQKIAAIPNAGELRQASDVTRGDMVQDSTGRKVGEGAIVNTMTGVTEQRQAGAAGAGGNRDVTVTARPTTTMGSGSSSSHQQQFNTQAQAHVTPVNSIAGASGAGMGPSAGGSISDREQRSGATQRPGETVPRDAGREAGSGPHVVHDGERGAYGAHDASTGRMAATSGMATHDSISKGGVPGTSTMGASSTKSGTVDAGYGKHQEPHHKEGLMGKVKHALGMEPKTSDSTRRV